jgi:hypothetical protein
MKTRGFMAGLLATGVCASSVAAADLCFPVAGQVRLDPDPLCQIGDLNPGPTYLHLLGIPDSCFAVRLRSPLGLAQLGSGFAGLTREDLSSPLGGASATPAFASESGVPVARQFITARSAVSLSLPFLGSGKIYTADAGVIAGSSSAEQLLITRGEGAFAGARGTIYTRGNIIGNWGAFNADVCIPR